MTVQLLDATSPHKFDAEKERASTNGTIHIY